MKKVVAISVFVLFSVIGFAQRNSQINGRVMDKETGESVIGANVSVQFGGELIGTVTDYDGYFKLKPLPANTFSVSVSYTGMQPHDIEVTLNPNQIYVLPDIFLSKGVGLKPIKVVAKTMVNPEETAVITMKAADLQLLPNNKNPVEMLDVVSPGVQVTEDKQVIMRGARPGSNAYYVDGMRVRSIDGGLPPGSIKSMSVYTGGVPAMYGDLTGGVVVIETNSYFDLYNQRKYGKR